MSNQAFNAYVEAWLKHGEAGETDEGRANLEEFLSTLAEDVVYEDVPTGHTYTGRDGVAKMCTLVSEHFTPRIEATSAYTDGERFAIEYTTVVTLGGKAVEGRGVGVGTIGGDGKVTSHRDYYDTCAMAAAKG